MLQSGEQNYVTYIFMSASASDFRSGKVGGLQMSLKALGTPIGLIEAIAHIITTWCHVQQGLQSTQWALTYGSLNPASIAITQAYSEQTHLLGWDNFLRGRISALWGRALSHHKSSRSTGFPSPKIWSTSLISLILDFSFSLWDFRNGVLHGRTVTEQDAKKRETLINAITRAYDDYHQDRFIAPQNFRYPFSSKSLHQRIHQDHDSLQCWLWSYREAVETQRASTNREKRGKEESNPALTYTDEESSWCSQSLESMFDSMLCASDTSCCSLDLSISSVDQMVGPNIWFALGTVKEEYTIKFLACTPPSFWSISMLQEHEFLYNLYTALSFRKP